MNRKLISRGCLTELNHLFPVQTISILINYNIKLREISLETFFSKGSSINKIPSSIEDRNQITLSYIPV